MKKSFAICIVAVLTVIPSFAAVEVGADMYVSPIGSRRIDFGGETGKDRVREILPTGASISATFFFREMKPFNVGLNAGISWDKVHLLYHDGQHKVDGGFNLMTQIGPAFEFMFGRHSLFISPGAFFNVMNAWDESGKTGVYHSALSFEYGFHINAAYRFWVVQKEKFGLGLDFGGVYRRDIPHRRITE